MLKAISYKRKREEKDELPVPESKRRFIIHSPHLNRKRKRAAQGEAIPEGAPCKRRRIAV